MPTAGPPAAARRTWVADLPGIAALPGIAELVAAATVVRIPLRVRFRGVDVREALLLRGPHGWGEFAPFIEYDDAESAPWLAAAIETGWSSWPAPVREVVPCNATVPPVEAADVAGVLARYDGCTTAKVKVAQPGQGLADDLSRVAAVRDVMGPTARIRVDANGGWAVEEATDALRRLSAYGLEYAEQPCAGVPELRRLRIALARRRIDVLVAADESVRRAQDPMLVVREEAADVVVVKVAPLGGVAAALAIAAACGLPAVVSSALDTSVGIAAGTALAAALPDLPYACGLGTVELLVGDVSRPSLVPVGGAIAVGRAQVDDELVQRWRAPEHRQQWWLRRLARCQALLGS